MENNTQPTSSTENVQKVGRGTRLRISKMSIVLIVISLLILMAAGSVAYYQLVQNLPSSTGAVNFPPDNSPTNPYVEYGKLLAKGNFSEDGFQVASVSASTKLSVFLDKPYAASQTKFEAWLAANGFGDIPKDQLIFFHNP